MPIVSSTTRMVWTMAMPRTSARYSADSAITCARPPGLAPSSADCRSQPCAKRKYAEVTKIMHSVEIASNATLRGKAANPLKVSGLTAAPREIPTSTEITRDSGAGTVIGRPASAATATASNEPMTNPAGRPRKARMLPPAAPTANVSAVRSSVCFDERVGGVIAAINAAPRFHRQTRWQFSRRPVGLTRTQHEAYELDCVLDAKFAHDACAMDFDRTRTDPQLPAGGLVGGA
jgi:hypothetical protein